MQNMTETLAEIGLPSLPNTGRSPVPRCDRSTLPSPTPLGAGGTALLRAAVVGQFRRLARKRCAIRRDAVACAVMSLFITPADAKAIDKAFREYKDAEQALHKAFLYRRPIEEIGSDIRTFQEKDASWASLREKFYQR